MMSSVPDNPVPAREPGSSEKAAGFGPRGASAQSTLAVGPRFHRRRAGYRLARRNRRRKPAVLSLNLTAMIDTVFNLLFFFMVASRFGAIEGLLSAPLPARASAAAAPSAEIPRTPLRVHLLPDPAAPARCRAVVEQLTDSPVEMAALPATLAKIRQTVAGFDDARVPVYLIAGNDVAWDHVVNAYNAALVAQYERIFFAGGQ